MTTADPKYLLRILGALDRFLTESLDPVLKTMGLGREHWQVLRLLEDGEGRPMGEIAQQAGLPRATATRVVDLLTAETLVYRRSDPLDRRRVLVYLGDPGAVCLDRVEQAMTAHASPAFDGIDAHERGKLVELVDRLVGVQVP